MKKNLIELDFIESLSCGNHELFHSNLLAFLAKYESEFFKSILACKDKPFPDYNTDKVSREFENLDLCFFSNSSDSIVFVIENKMKSIPYKKQLREYQKKVEKHNAKSDVSCEYLLLTLLKPDWTLPNWQILTYGELAMMMETNLAKLHSRDICYLFPFIHDYIVFIRQLDQKIHEAEDFIKNSDLSLREVNEVNLRNKWENILVKKARYHAMANQLGNDCKELENVEITLPFNHGTPILEALIYYNADDCSKNGKTRKKKSQSMNTVYFVHLDGDTINRGFRIYDKESKKYRKKYIQTDQEKEERDKFLKDKWKKEVESSIGKKINTILESLPSRVKLEEFSSHEKGGKAFVFDDFAMPYISEKIEGNKSVLEILKIMAKEIKEISQALLNN